MRQWSKLFLCSFLVLWSTASSQNATSDIENDRQTRQTKQDCCPCPNSPASPMGRTGELECPCLSRAADAEASPSLLTPSVIRPNSRKNEKKEDPKPLLHPEVDFASSVLETLREATDEEYKEAVARDAERSLAKPDKSRDMSENGSQKIVTIIVNSKEPKSADDVVAEASQVQETRVPPLNGFSLHPLRTQQLHKVEQKDTNKNIFDDIDRKFDNDDLGESVFDNDKTELKIKHDKYMEPKNAVSLSKNSFNGLQTNEENTKSLNNINNDCTEKTAQTNYNLKLRSNSGQSSPDFMQSSSNDIFKTQPMPKINVNDSPNVKDSNKQDTSSRNSQNYDRQNNNLIRPLKKSLNNLQNFFNSRNVKLFDPIELATQLRDATKNNVFGLKRIPSSLTKLDPFLKNNINVKDDNTNVNNINFTQKENNEFNTQKDPEASASEYRQVTELKENSDEADFIADFNTSRSRSKNMDYSPEIKSSTTDEDEDDLESKSSEQDDYENNKSNAKFFSDKSVHDTDISDNVEWSDLDSTLEEEERKEQEDENVKDFVSLNDLQKLSDSLLNESSIRQTKNSEKLNCGIEKIGDINAGNIRDSEKSSSHKKEETENIGILNDASDVGTYEKTCSSDMQLKNSDSQEMKVEASDPIANKLALPTLILPNDDILGSLHNIIVEPSSLFNTPQFDIFKSAPIFNIHNILNQPLPSLDELRFRISDILGRSKGSDASSEIDFDVGNSNINPIVSELSKYKSNLLRNPSQDADFDLIQLRPLASSQPHQIKSKLPRYDLNSYQAKLAVPKSLGIKPLKLESTFKNEGGFFDASLNFGPDLIKSAKRIKPAKKERAQFGRLKQMRKNSPVFGIDTPLWPDDPLNTASKHLQSRAEKSMKKLQQTLDSSHKERHTNGRNLFSDTLIRPQDLLRKTLPIHNNIQEKLQSLQVDLNDRLSSLQRSIIEEPKWPTLVNPTINKINRRSKNAKSATAKTVTPLLLTREYQSNIVNRPSEIAESIPHILRNTKLGSLQPKYSKQLRTAASSLSPEIIDIQSFNSTSSKSETDSETRNTSKEYDSKPLNMGYNTKIRRLLEIIRKSRMDKLKSVLKPLGLSEVKVSFSTTSRPTTENNDIFNLASLQGSTFYSKPKDTFPFGSKLKSLGDTTESPSELVNIEAPFFDNLGGLRAEANPDLKFNRRQRPSTLETDQMLETPLDVIIPQSRSQKLKVTNCEDMKNIDYRREADTNVLSFRESEKRIKPHLNVENSKKLHIQPFIGSSKNDYNEPRNVPKVKEEETPLLSKLRAIKTKKTTRDSDADIKLSSSEMVQRKVDKLRSVIKERPDTFSFTTRLKQLPLKNDKVAQTDLSRSPSFPPSLTNTKCEPIALVYGLNNLNFTVDDRNESSSELIRSKTPFHLNKQSSIGAEQNYARSSVNRMEKPLTIALVGRSAMPPKKGSSLLARLRDAKRKVNSAANPDTDLTWSPSNTVEARFNKFRTSSEESSDKGPEVGRPKPPTLKNSKGPQNQSNINTSRSKPPTLTNTNCEGMSETDFTRDAHSVGEYENENDFTNDKISIKTSSLNFSDELRAADEKHDVARNIRPPTLKNDKVLKTLNVNTSQSRPPTLTVTDCEGMKDTDYMREVNPNPPASEKDLTSTSRRSYPEALVARNSYKPLKLVATQRRKNSLLPRLKDEERKINPAADSYKDLTWSPSNTVEARFNKFRTSSEESSDKGPEVGRPKPPTLKNSKGPQTQSNINTSRSKPPTLTNTNCEGMSETDFTRDAHSVGEYENENDFTNDQINTKTSSLNFSDELRAADENHDNTRNIRPPTVKNDKVSKTLNVTTSQSRPPTLTVTNCEGMKDTDYRS